MQGIVCIYWVMKVKETNLFYNT